MSYRPKISGEFQLEEATDRPGNDYARHMEDSSDSCRTAVRVRGIVRHLPS